MVIQVCAVKRERKNIGLTGKRGVFGSKKRAWENAGNRFDDKDFKRKLPASMAKVM